MVDDPDLQGIVHLLQGMEQEILELVATNFHRRGDDLLLYPWIAVLNKGSHSGEQGGITDFPE